MSDENEVVVPEVVEEVVAPVEEVTPEVAPEEVAPTVEEVPAE